VARTQRIRGGDKNRKTRITLVPTIKVTSRSTLSADMAKSLGVKRGKRSAPLLTSKSPKKKKKKTGGEKRESQEERGTTKKGTARKGSQNGAVRMLVTQKKHNEQEGCLPHHSHVKGFREGGINATSSHYN